MTSLAFAMLASSIALVAYAVAGYPALLRAAGALRRKRSPPLRPPEPSPEEELPMITITVPAYNEEAQIRETILSLLALDYPPSRRQILIVSDGSTDRTDEIVRNFRSEGVELLRVEGRRGKSAVENAAYPRLNGEIVVNTDASIRLHPQAVRALVSAFSDPGVGVASGRDVSVAHMEDDANAGESGYVGYEMWVRDLETSVGGIVGSSGCLYAIRRKLHCTPVPGELSRDFSSALIAREEGYRAVSVRDALCYVPRANSLRREYPRKVRTIARGLRTLFARGHLMNPLRHGLFAWKLLSHKLCRWLVPWALLMSALAIFLLAPEHRWAQWLAAGVAALLLAALIGWLWPEDRDAPPLFALPAYFIMGNVATLHAWMRAMGGRRDAIWEPTRRAPAAVPGVERMDGTELRRRPGARVTTPRS